MEKLTFEAVYEKYLKIVKKDDNKEMYKDERMNMTQEQQVNFLKSLGKQNFGYDNYKIDSYTKDFEKNSYGSYIVRTSLIGEPILDKDCNIVEQPLSFSYKTCIVAISEDNNQYLVMDNISMFESDVIDLVKTKYNELCDIIKSNTEEEILTFIDSKISEKI